MTTKTASILAHFLKPDSLNTFEAERHGDHSLNSTVSTLANVYGLKFNRAWEQVPNRFGSTTRVIRYSLKPDELPHAAQILDLMLKRGRP